MSERLKTLLSVVSPLAAGTVFLFYFGWVRTTTEAAALGYDAKILQFTTADYVLRSINVLSVPIVAFLLVMLIGLRAHGWISTRLEPARRLRLARALLRSWLFWVIAGVFLAVFVPAVLTPALPALLTLAVGGALYGDHLRATVGSEPRSGIAVRIVLIALLAMALIGDTERLARAMGEGFAATVAANPAGLAAVEVYSTRDLALAVPNVTVTTVGGTDAAFRFRYDGLHLLQRSGDKYLLINDGWSRATGVVVMLRDGADVRLEFRR